MKKLKFFLVICTKNRFDDISITLKSIIKQTILPDTLIIIDDSDNNILEEFIKENIEFNKIEIHYEKPNKKSTGITQARNRSLKYLKKDGIVLFLDDDVLLEQNCLEELLKPYIISDQIIGAQPVELSVFQFKSKTEFIKKIIYYFFTGKSIYSQKVSFFFENYPPLLSRSNKDLINVQWLAGCCMSYRTEVFLTYNCRFDENLVKYSLGEDMFFSYELFRKGSKLVLINNSKLMHQITEKSKNSIKNDEKKLLTMQLGYNRYFLTKIFGNGIRKKIIFTFSLMRLCKYGMKNYCNNPNFINNFIFSYRIFKIYIKDIDRCALSKFNKIFTE